MNSNIDLALLDSLNEQDSLILSGTDATDPFTDNFPAPAALDPLDPSLLSWPLSIDLDATHSNVTDSSGSVADGLTAATAEPPAPAPSTRVPAAAKKEEPMPIFTFANASPPPPLSLAASLAAPVASPAPAAPMAHPPTARPRAASSQSLHPQRVCVKMEPATAHSGEVAPPNPASPTPSSGGTHSETHSANTRPREPVTEAERQKEKLAQRKQRNKESARRYREKQVARRRQLENFTRSLAEQNRELEALHDRLLALACDRRLRVVAPASASQRFAQHHPVAPPLQ